MSEQTTCPNCGAALMPGDIFCGECGARVQTPAYDVAPAAPLEDVSPQPVEEPLSEEPGLAAEPPAGEYIPPPPLGKKASDWTASRIVAFIVAVVFLILSLCFCSLGGFALIPTEDYPTVGDSLGFATALCFVPGVILGLLGIGAAYFGFRKR